MCQYAIEESALLLSGMKGADLFVCALCQLFIHVILKSAHMCRVAQLLAKCQPSENE